MSPALAGGFLTTAPPGKPPRTGFSGNAGVGETADLTKRREEHDRDSEGQICTFQGHYQPCFFILLSNVKM